MVILVIQTNFLIVFSAAFPNSAFIVVANEGWKKPAMCYKPISINRFGFTAAVTELNENVQSGSVIWFAIGY